MSAVASATMNPFGSVASWKVMRTFMFSVTLKMVSIVPGVNSPTLGAAFSSTFIQSDKWGLKNGRLWLLTVWSASNSCLHSSIGEGSIGGGVVEFRSNGLGSEWCFVSEWWRFQR